MPGTSAAFEGIKAVGVAVRQSRGWSADVAELLIPAKAFPSFKLKLPQGPDALVAPSTRSTSWIADELRELRESYTAPKSGDLPDEIPYEGTIFLGEEIDGEEFTHVFPGWLVRRLETAEQDDVGDVTIYRLILTDARALFGDRGISPEHSFNRARFDGSIAPDSMNPDTKKPWTLAEVVQRIASRLPRSPKISIYPEDWDHRVVSVELEPMPFAVQALAQVVRDEALEEPCPQSDGSIALFPPGVGKVGYSSGAVGGQVAKGGNVADFNPSHLLYEEGTGQGHVQEPQYPPGYVIVEGDARVATVALDDCEPVLVVDKPYPLNEETVRKLTSGRFGMEWLLKWVLAPAAYQGDVALPASVVSLLRRQALRLWRIPGAVAADGKPGPNAHLLPLRPRAEIVGNKRIEVTVETYRFEPIHVALWSDQASIDEAVAIRELANIEKQRQIEAIKTGGGGTTLRPQAVASLGGILANTVSEKDPDFAFLHDRYDEIEAAYDLARQASSMDKYAPGLASQFRAQLEKKFAAEDTIKGTAKSHVWKVAQQLAALEAQLEARRADKSIVSTVTLGDKALAGERLRVGNALKALALEIRRSEKDAAERRKVGAAFSSRPQNAVTHRNLPRSVDSDARVFDAHAGIIETSTVAGHLTRQDVPTPLGGGPLVPCPVRVIFGATMRPRADRIPTPPVAPKAGAGSSGNPTKTSELLPADTFTSEQQLQALLSGGSANEPKKPDQLDQIQAARKAALIATGVPADQAEKIAASERAATDAALVAEARHHTRCPGGATKIPEVLSDRETLYTAAFRRTGQGVVERVKLDQVQWPVATKIVKKDLVELVRLDGASNVARLDQRALSLARAKAFIPDVRETTKHVIGRVVPVQVNGNVAAVEYLSDFDEQGGMCGFRTIVHTGSTEHYQATALTTKTRRPPRMREVDGPRREGLTT